MDEGIGGEAPPVETVVEIVEVEPTAAPTTAPKATPEAEHEHHQVTPEKSEKPGIDPAEAPSSPEELAQAEEENIPTPSPIADEESVPTPDDIPEAPALPDFSSSEPNLDAFTPQKWIRPAVKVNDPEYFPFGHWPYKLPSDKPIWNEPLGKKLCIVDLESRRFDKPGQIWSDEMTWNKSKEVHGPSGGTLNHWVYCMSLAN